MRLAQLIALGCLAACTKSQSPEPQGYLYFGAGYSLGRFELRSGESEVVANLGEVTITQIDGLQDGALLLSLRQDRVGRGREGLFIFNLESNRASRWMTGRSGQYLKDLDTVIYDDETALKSVPRGGRRSQAKSLFSHPFNARFDVVQVANSDVVFAPQRYSSRELDATIRRYSHTNDAVEPLNALSGVCSLDGAVWIEDEDRLLCVDSRAPRENLRYQLVSLDGEIDRPITLPSGHSFRAVTYLAGQRMIVLTESTRRTLDDREVTNVWIHHLDTGESKRIADNQYLGRSVAYSQTEEL